MVIFSSMGTIQVLRAGWYIKINIALLPLRVCGSVRLSVCLRVHCPVAGRETASPVWGADEDAVGQLPIGILCTALRPSPGVGSKDQTEMEGGAEAGAGRVMGSTWTRAERKLISWEVSWFSTIKQKLASGERREDGRRVRGGDHLPPHRYIRNTSTRGIAPIEPPLNAGRRPQTSQKARNSPTYLGR